MSEAADIVLGEKLSEQELCPADLLAGQEAAFARDIARLQRRRSEFVLVDCPACGDAARQPFFAKFDFDFVSCTACRTIYMTPRPSPAVMAAYYASSENYAFWATHIFPASEAARRERIHKPWLERVIGYCDRPVSVPSPPLPAGPMASRASLPLSLPRRWLLHAASAA